MKNAQIPGLSLAVVKNGETLYKSGFGYANLKTKAKVTTETLFQLASNSKAFTALGVFQLVQDNLVKLSDPISLYIPELKLLYDQKEVDVTIADFLHHTSGVSSSTMYLIPVLEKENDNAIEKTVRKIINLELVSKPGTKYQYATINYDVLAYLIEKVSGMSYEAYLQKYVLDPAGLNNTCMFRSDADPVKMTNGYKMGFLMPQSYDAPWYEGNKPAGYIISNADDMATWMNVQMNTCDSSKLDQKLIEQSHVPNLDVDTFGEEMSYAGGWIVYENDGTEIFHSGSNPNFSSYIILRPEKKLGIAVLCNTKTSYSMNIAQSVIQLFADNQSKYTNVIDLNQLVDKACTVIIFILLFFILVNIYLLVCLIQKLAKNKEKSNTLSRKSIIDIIIKVILFLIAGCMVYFIPQLLFGGTPWSYLIVWYPVTVKVLLYHIYLLLAIMFVKSVLKLLDKNR